MFEDATFHSRGILTTHSRQWMLLTFALNCAVVATLVIIPLLAPQQLTSSLINRILYAPPAQPPPLIHHDLTQAAPASTQPATNPFAAPRIIPNTINTDPGPAPNPTIIDLSNTGPGITGAEVSTPSTFPHTPPPTVRPAPNQPITISRGVSEGLRLYTPSPIYPPIARSAHVSGTVVLAATISTQGRIENLRVVSGNPMLTTAAIGAVKTWRYRPYQLNGQPVEVETTINIVFNLGSN